MVRLVFTAEYAGIFLAINGLIILFYLGAIQQNKKRAMKFGNYETLEKVADRSFIKSSNIILLFRLVGISLILVGMSSPVAIQDRPSADTDYVIAMDSSSSMLTTDIEPSRLEASKDISQQFLGELPEATDVGVVSFSGSPNVEHELSTDRQSLEQSIDGISIGGEAGTAIGDGVISGSTLLLNSSQERNVILITGSSNTVGTEINESVEFAETNNVTVNTIGVGMERENTTEQEVDELDGLNATRAEFPNPEREELEFITNMTGGNSSMVESHEEFETAFSEISTTETRTDLSRLFILFGLIALLLEWVLGSTKYSVIP